MVCDCGDAVDPDGCLGGDQHSDRIVWSSRMAAEGKPERLRYEQFCSRFGSDQLVLISWDGASLTDSRLEKFVVNLESHPEFDRFFSKIESPQRIAESLSYLL